jgi:hypothetical protein
MEEDGVEDGNTHTKRKKEYGIREAEAKAVLAAAVPTGVPACALTKPLLSVHAASVRVRTPKVRWICSLGFLR